MILSKLCFTAYSEERSGRGHLLWPWMHLRNFFTPEEMEMIYSILLDSSNFLNHSLTLSTTWNHRSQGGGWVMALLISTQTVCEGPACSASYLLHAGNGARNILSVGPTPPAAHQSRQVGIQLCSFFGGDIFPMQQPEMGSERSHLISCSTPSLPDQCDHTVLSKRDYKQKIWPFCLLVWFCWLFLKANSIWKLKIKTAAFCITIDNRCPASNSNFPSIYTSISPMGQCKTHPQLAQFLCTSYRLL